MDNPNIRMMKRSTLYLLSQICFSVGPMTSHGSALLSQYDQTPPTAFPAPTTAQQKGLKNSTNKYITATTFPKTTDDLSFAARIEILTEGYLPYKDAQPYTGLDIETQEEAWNHRLAALEQKRQNDAETMPLAEYCDKYLDPQKCDQDQEYIYNVIAQGYEHTRGTRRGTQQPSTGNNQNGTPTPNNNEVPQNDTHNPVVPPQFTNIPPRTNPGETTPKNFDTPRNNTSETQYIGLLEALSINPTQTGPMTNNQLRSGQCTQPDLWVEQGFTEASTRRYTTGRYFQTDQPFAKSMLAVMQSEGMTCAPDPSNSGSLTCYGFMQSANPDIDVRTLNLSSAEDRTYQRYYRDLGIYKLPDSVAGDVMHASFWRGPAKGIPTLCTVLGTPCKGTGRVSDELARAAASYSGDLHNDYWDQTWTELLANNRQSLWKAFARRVANARNNGCHVEPRHPVRI